MIVFITSIKHHENCISYERVWELLNNTLTSVCNQTDEDFRVIVVCTKTLPVMYNRDKILKHTEFIEVDFPPVSQTGYEGIRVDRGTKYCIGLVAAGKHNPDYIMFFDADDYIAKNIVEFTNSRPTGNGWIMDKGFTLIGNKILQRNTNFNKVCGTSNIINYRLLMSGIRDGLTINSTQQDILDATDDYYLHYVIGSHKFYPNYFAERGAPLEYLPYHGAVHLVGTGENHSDFISYSQQMLDAIDSTSGVLWTDLTDELREFFTIPA